ncbi:MAG: RNA polymerase-binding transcription factor [Chlamydiae bacterium RIFCSPHIGHO2_12_FULL_49_11]|nr:MAG: RNA polymerase-binding transcription factor [Chlamydiae bacterium RIFCSPHIGHO2_12_FULL_49_11]
MGLSEKEIEGFRQKLLALKLERGMMVSDLADDIQSSDESKGASQHHADEGTDDFDRTISISVSTSEMKIMKQIDRALEKIEEGTFGLCDVTGKEIPKKRLEAVPYATTTIEAQKMLEEGLL